jgi:uncharacterized protein (UPF0276 family)
MAFTRKHIGHGIGLRTQHFPDLLAAPPPVDWLEVISENFMSPGGRPLAVLEKVRRDVPVVLHGVSLSIGSTDPLSAKYLDDLARLASRIEPAWISDHLCWSSVAGRYAHDLLPLPYTEEALDHVVQRVLAVQERLGRRILLENVSSYLVYTHSTISEWEFLGAVADRADCGLLLDVNNVYVSAVNHGFAAEMYLAGLPADRVGQIHLAGHTDMGAYLFDTHDGPVTEAVWDLYRHTVRRFGRVSTLVEWDDRVPDLDIVCAEADRAREVEAAILGAVSADAA